jgi:hypothetical protein
VLLGRKSSGSDLEIRDYGRGDPLCWARNVYPQKLALTSPTIGGHSVGILHSRTQTREFSFQFFEHVDLKLRVCIDVYLAP